MAKFEEVFQDTKELFDNHLAETGLERVINVKVLADNNQKKIGKVTKASPILKFETNNDIYIYLNERVFEQLTEEQKIIVVEELITGISYNSETDALTLLPTDVNTYSGVLRKFGNDAHEVLRESLVTLFSNKKTEDAEEEKV